MQTRTLGAADFTQKTCAPLTIVGAGLSGKAAARLLKCLGWKEGSDFLLFDEKAPPTGFLTPAEMLAKFKPQTLLVSPGVPLTNAWIHDFTGNITSEIALAYEFLENEKIVAVTGSLGKSTTVGLLGAGLASTGLPYFIGGNFGFPAADYVADCLEQKRPRAAWLVLELSSFQLENLGNFNADAAIFTYLSSNHLERYESREHYFQTKWNLAARTRGPLIINKNGGDLANFAKVNSAQLEVHVVSAADHSLNKVDVSRAQILGDHNADNLALAVAVAKLCQWPETYLDGMLRYGGLPHRIQNVGTFRGVTFINDSKATTMESVLTAVQSVKTRLKGDAKLHLLLGGRDKKLPWQDLHPITEMESVHPTFFGECALHAKKTSGLGGFEYRSLREALGALGQIAHAGDIVLLSPGGTSLDEFKNFEERGNSFAQLAEDFFNR